MDHPIVISSDNKIYERKYVNRWKDYEIFEPSWVYNPLGSLSKLKIVIK